MNEAKLKQLFSEALGIPVGTISDDLAYNALPQWDSVAHMALIAALDEGFGIMIETEDVIDMSSFGKAKEILGRYGVNFQLA
jgi:acyl carrier protein